MTADPRALLVVPPFGSLHYPFMGPSLLKPVLAARGIACEVRYLSLDFAEAIGPEAHDALVGTEVYEAFLGEWAFLAAARGEAPPGDLAYFRDVLAARWPELCTPDRIHTALAVRAAADAWIEGWRTLAAWGSYDVVGFSVSYQQTMAALALARRVKAAFPHVSVVFGGANCQGPMGEELLARYPCIDAVCTGEGESALPDWIEGRTAVPGMAVRGEPVPPDAPFTDLDTLPRPDFSDYFGLHAACPRLAAARQPVALLETSRGCWWGARHHCTFCGLNGLGMAYRRKSPDRAWQEIVAITERWGDDLVSVDNILDTRSFGTLLPRLAREGPGITMYVELKANLDRRRLETLAAAGLRKIQPGIESLSSHVLALMDKGCTMLGNVRTLKLAAECGLYVEWNLLWGFPGETAADYDGMAALMPLLHHLHPPGGAQRVRADRFSPYHATPERWGITVAPAPIYALMHPFEAEAVARLAYHHDIVEPSPPDVTAATERCLAAYRTWRARHGESGLSITYCVDGTAVVDDRRQERPRRIVLDPAAAAIHRAAADITSRNALPPETQDAVERLLADGLLLAEGDALLSLALPQPGPARALSWAKIRSARNRKRWCFL